MPNKNSIESEIDILVNSVCSHAIPRPEAVSSILDILQREVKKGRVEVMEDIRLAKPAKLKSVRGKEDASSARIGYIGGWNAYYEKLQPILKQVEKSDRLEELEG